MANKIEKPTRSKKNQPKDRKNTPHKTQNSGSDPDKKQEAIEAVKSSLGIISNACFKCKISRQTFYNWYHNDAEFKAAIDEVTETQKDFVEGSLLKKIKDGDTSCIIFYCKTRMKDRGYAERVEITGKDGEAIQNETAITSFSDVLSKMAGKHTKDE